MISHRPAMPSRPAPRSPLHAQQTRNASASAPPAPQLNILTSTSSSVQSPNSPSEPRSPLSPPGRPAPTRPSSSSLSTLSPSSLSSARQSIAATSPSSEPTPPISSSPSSAATPTTAAKSEQPATTSASASKGSDSKPHRRVPFNPHVHTVPFSAFPDLSPNSPPTSTSTSAASSTSPTHTSRPASSSYSSASASSAHRLPYPLPVLCTTRPVTADWSIQHNTTLGSGFSSTVKLATSLHTTDSNPPLHAACKIIDKRTANLDLVKFADECRVLSDVGWHGNIVALYGSYESETHVYVLTEVCRGGELFDVLCERGEGGGGMDEWEAAPIIAQLLEALAYLHSRGICHRDVKPENCLFLEPYHYTPPSTSPASTHTTNHASTSTTSRLPPTSAIPNLKLSDFGFAANLLTKPRALRASSHLGSLGYTAPEIFNASSYTESCDIWSVGAILHIMMTGTPPYTSIADDERRQPFWLYVNEMRWGERQGEVVVGGRGWEGRSEEVQSLVKGMLELDVGKRLRASEALQSGWVKEGRERWKRANAAAEQTAGGEASGWSSLSVRERTTSKADTQLTMREVMAEIVLRAAQTKGGGGVEGEKEEEECKVSVEAEPIAVDGAAEPVCDAARLEKRPVAQRRLKALTMLDWGRG